MDRSYRPEMTTLEALRFRKLAVLQAQGWPENSENDTIGGAACFMAFAHVDVSLFICSQSLNHAT